MLRQIAVFVVAGVVLGGWSFGADQGGSASASGIAELSPFGIGSCYTNNRSAEDDARWAPAMQEIGLHVMRTPHTAWNALEPEAGKWAWGALDEQVKYLSDHGFGFGAILIGSPEWNKLDAPGTLPVKNLAGWSAYVEQVARHLKGKVHDFEVWNEPPNGTGPKQTAADYARLVASADEAVKAVDPQNRIGLASKSVDVNYLEEAIDAGAKDHFDYIILHPYESLGAAVDHANTEPMFLSIVPTVRKMLRARDPARADVPIIFTELGSDAGKDAAHAAQALVKAYAMGIAQGVSCIQWFEGRDGDSGPMGLLDGQGKPRPAYGAMRSLIRHLGQHPKAEGWLLLNQRDWVFVFSGDAGPVMVGWAPIGQQDSFDPGAAVRVVDPLTGNIASTRAFTLTEAPALILDVPARLLADARANRGKPIPWQGDYSAATSVSVTFGEQNLEKGLHTQSATSIARDVLAYGGSARTGSVPGGNVFMVDPGFLSYTHTPIEITITTRRDANNTNAGFKLNYESTHGFKNLGWYTVPDNRQWHTKTWRIDDAEFVGMYGFNFSLDSDGNEYNRYDIQSVVVRKVGE